MDEDRYRRRPGGGGREDYGGLDIEVVVVVAGYGEVPHPAVVHLRGGAAVGGGDRVVGCLEVLALLQLARGYPLVQVIVAENCGLPFLDQYWIGSPNRKRTRTAACALPIRLRVIAARAGQLPADASRPRLSGAGHRWQAR